MSLARHWRHGRAAETLAARRFVFADIGARDGLPRHWAAMGPLLEVVAFEPDAQEARRLSTIIGRSGAQAHVLPFAAWDSTGERPLHLTRGPGCSSLYRPHTAFVGEFPEARRFDILSTPSVPLVPLDALEPPPANGPVRFIKIDVQGGALNVLQGAAGTLDTVVGLEIEVELAPLYEGEPLFGEVDAWLRARGYELVDLRPTYWRREAGRQAAGTRGQLIFADALYMLSPRVLAGRAQAAADAAHLEACAMLACDVYGLRDWMLAYATALEERGVGGSALRARVTGDPWWTRAVPFRYHLGLWLKDLGDALIEAPSTWATAEQRLGNTPRRGPEFVLRLLRRLRRTLTGRSDR